MSKTLLSDTKNLYQIGIVVTSLLSLTLLVLVVIQSLKLFQRPHQEPSIKISEQQLNQAINLTFPKEK